MEKNNKKKNSSLVIKKQSILFLVISFCIIVLSCSSPDSEGEKAGKIQFDCYANYSKNINAIYLAFINDLETFSFKTRPEACELLSAKLQKEEHMFLKCKEDADNDRSILESKYQTNIKQTERFNENYLKQTQGINQVEINLRSNIDQYEKQIDTLIRTKIPLPPKPDTERMKKDFVEKLEKKSRILVNSGSFLGMTYTNVELIKFEMTNISEMVDRDLLLCDFQIIFHTGWYIVNRKGYFPYKGVGRMNYSLKRCDSDWESHEFSISSIKELGFD